MSYKSNNVLGGFFFGISLTCIMYLVWEHFPNDPRELVTLPALVLTIIGFYLIND